MTYRKFTEWNDHEGEQWYFFFPDDEKICDKIRKILDSFPWEDCPYRLSSKTYTEEQVDFLVSEASWGYICSHNKCVVLVDKLPDGLVDWDNEDPFYKGRIFEDV